MVFLGRACAVTFGAGSVFLETKSTEMTIPKADIALSAETLPTPEVSYLDDLIAWQQGVELATFRSRVRCSTTAPPRRLTPNTQTC